MSDLNILYGYSWFPSEGYGNVKDMTMAYFERLNEAGFSVEGFCLTLNPPRPCLTFKELDNKWKRRDRTLLKMYERLELALEGKDILLNGPGINLHPEFIEKLPVFTVFQCFDDPENSENLSKPAAAAYDLCLVGNIAEIDTYYTWGVKHAEWVPMGLQPTIYDRSLTYDNILNGNRDIDLFMMIDRASPWRKERLDKMAAAFPNAHFYGKKWPRGYLSNGKELEYLRRAKIGPNIHNSTGPINYRTFYLPANGVMQICDNKSHLGRIYALKKEVVGFDSIEECIDLCRYYLSHDAERKKIAANGWKRAVENYAELPVFRRNVEIFKKYMDVVKKDKTCAPPIFASAQHIHNTKVNCSDFYPLFATQVLLNFVRKNVLYVPRVFRHWLMNLPNLMKKRLSLPVENSNIARNIGDNLLEWPDRIDAVIELITKFFDLNTHMTIADYGCGKQTLRKRIPSSWSYTPFDYTDRSLDTIICDFNRELPMGDFDIIIVLGVLEYLDNPYTLLLHAIQHSRYTVFSYSAFTTEERRNLQGWKNNLALCAIEQFLGNNRSQILYTKHYSKNQWIYFCANNIVNG